MELTLTIPEVHERWAKVANFESKQSPPRVDAGGVQRPVTAAAAAPHDVRTPSPPRANRAARGKARRSPPKRKGSSAAEQKTPSPPRGLRRFTFDVKAAGGRIAELATRAAAAAATAVTATAAPPEAPHSPTTPPPTVGGAFGRAAGEDRSSPPTAGSRGGAVDASYPNSKVPTIGEWSPIHAAADGGRTAEVAAIVAAGGTGSDRGGVDMLSDVVQRLTPLHRACQRGHPDTVSRLLELGADPRAVDHHNHTPLHWAAFGGCSKSVVDLVCNCAEVEAVDNSGQTAIQIATAKGFSDIVRHLESAGATVPAEAGSLSWAMKSFWAPNAQAEICMCCKITEFNMMSNWRHHCRWCGDVVCNGCARKGKPPFLDETPGGDVRNSMELVCFTCFQKMHAFPAGKPKQGDADAARKAQAVAAAKAAAAGKPAPVEEREAYAPKPGGRHQHIRLLGQGAFGDTSLVMDSKAHVYRAQKEVRCKDMTDANAAIKEATTMLPLSHPGLVQALDLWMEADAKQRFTVNILMEYCNSKDLFVYMTTARVPIPESTIVSMMVPLMEAVAYIHREGVMHRDIKPANIFLNKAPGSKQLIAKLGDFGLAQKLKGRFAQSLAGTLVYMAPEQQRGLYDSKVDVWGLGATLAAVANRREMRVIITTKTQAASLPNVIPKKSYSLAFIKAVTCMLTYDPKERPSARKVLIMEPFKSAVAKNKGGGGVKMKKKVGGKI